MQELRIEDFPLRSFDKVRYADTDRQGHVNNAVFSSFLETGRVEVLYSKELPVLSEGASFVIASLKLDFASEITWPGQVEIGTGILKIGNSSIILYQELFQGGIRVAKAETIIVQIHNDTKASFSLGENAKGILKRWLLNR